MLGVGESLVVPGGVAVPGEMLGDWKRHLNDMALAVGLWELRQTVNVKALARHIKWEKDEKDRHKVVFRSHPEPGLDLPALGRVPTTTVIASADKHPELLDQWLGDGFPPGDLGRPALALGQRIIEKHLRQLKESVQPHLTWNADLQRPTLTFTAQTLIGGLWLEFAAAVAADRAFRRCEGCKKWMELGGLTVPARISVPVRLLAGRRLTASCRPGYVSSACSARSPSRKSPISSMSRSTWSGSGSPA